MLLQFTNIVITMAEKNLLDGVIADLRKTAPPGDRKQCDSISSRYSAYLRACVQNSMASRAADFSVRSLIPAILALEQELGVKFHKGALFHDTAIAATFAGNEDLFDYLLAMTDEEEVRTAGNHPRGTFNLANGGMAKQVLEPRLQFACDFLNGTYFPGSLTYAAATARPAITVPQLEQWRTALSPQHQFEFWRVVHDLDCFIKPRFALYPEVLDNPFILLRLAKALAHLAQLAESCLTEWQGGGGGTLSPKLHSDIHFGPTLSNAAGNQNLFAGNTPHGADVAIEISQLVAAVKIHAGDQRDWRILRIFFIVRNSTAHVIDPALPYYSNRALSVEVAQMVLLSLFIICQRKGRPMP